MTNWFQTHTINPIYGWGPTKRMIVQGGYDTNVEPLELVQQARKAGCVYVEIRCFEDYSAYRTALEAAGFVYEPHYDVHIDPMRDVPEAKMRQIRAAIASGQRWREVGFTPFPSPDSEGRCEYYERDLKAWYECLKNLYRTKVKRPIPSLEWFRSMIIEKRCKLLVVEAPNLHLEGKKNENDKRIVGGVLLAVEDDKSKAYEWYICGQVMSTWAAIEWCRQQGVRCFDTMGAGEPNIPYGVRDFKLQMGGTLHEFGRYRCVLRPLIYHLGQLVYKKKLFPFCYLQHAKRKSIKKDGK